MAVTRYALPADLARYVPSSAIASIPLQEQQDALDAASSEFNGALGNQYTLPLIAPFPPDLVRHVCSYAIWALLSKRGFNPEKGANATFVTNYQAASSWMLRVGRREIQPDGIQDSSPQVARGGPRVYSKPPR